MPVERLLTMSMQRHLNSKVKRRIMVRRGPWLRRRFAPTGTEKSEANSPHAGTCTPHFVGSLPALSFDILEGFKLVNRVSLHQLHRVHAHHVVQNGSPGF